MVRDYSKGVIYKLICKDVNVKEIYVGSSLNMKQRKKYHKEDTKKKNTPVYKFIKENGGFDNWSMIWIKDYPCNSKRELEAEEDKIMRELNAELNTNNAIHNIQKRIDYLEKNKEKRKKQIQEYTKTHKEDKKKYDKEYREKHINKKKEYYENNKEELKKKASIIISCECGCEIRKASLSRHRKSKKHLDLISS